MDPDVDTTDDGGGFNWAGLSDFIYSVEGPTLGIISLAKGGSVSQGSDGSLSATATPNGTFAGPGAAGTGRGIADAAAVSSQVVATAPALAFFSRPGSWLLLAAGLVVVVAIAKS